MAKIIVGRTQQEEMLRKHPVSIYSRQVCIDLHVPIGSGHAIWFVTPPLGNRLWLLGVDIWLMNYHVDIPAKGWIVISTGMGRKPSAEEVVYKWENLLPVVGHTGPWFLWYGIRGHRHYSMMKFYEGLERRFAAYIENKQDNIDWYAHVSFEISEG